MGMCVYLCGLAVQRLRLKLGLKVRLGSGRGKFSGNICNLIQCPYTNRQAEVFLCAFELVYKNVSV